MEGLERHEAIVSAGQVQDFDCAHCGWSGEAAATGRGHSVGAAQYGDDGEETLLAAQGLAAKEALDHIAMAPCPGCGRRPGGSRLRILGLRGGVVLAIVGVFWAGAGWLATWLATSPDAGSEGWLLFAALLILGPGLAATRALSWWRLLQAQGALSFKPGS